MVSDKFDLKMLFKEMIELAIEDMRAPESESARMGFGCSKLLEDMLARQDPLLDRILNDYTNDSHEYRLNGAGLKMHWRMYKNENVRKFLCTISGDQFKDYEVLGTQLRMLIKQAGCCKLSHDEQRRADRVYDDIAKDLLKGGDNIE